MEFGNLLVFQEGGKPEYPEKNLSEQELEPTTHINHYQVAINQQALQNGFDAENREQND